MQYHTYIAHQFTDSDQVELNPIWFRGGTLCPTPKHLWGRVPILFGNDLPRKDLSYSKGFMKFGCPEPSEKMFDF